jgi:hypothetical protein
VKDGVREFPPYEETIQRCWTAYKLITPAAKMLWTDDQDMHVGFWLHWVHRAEFNVIALFLGRERRFPVSADELADEMSGELLIQAKAKVLQAGKVAGAPGAPYDFTWTKDEGFVFHMVGTGQRIHLAGPLPGPHPFGNVT